MNATSKMMYDIKMTERPELPHDEVAFLESLSRPATESRIKALWQAGWSLSIIGRSINPPRPKTTIHFWVRRAKDEHQFRPIPTPPPKSFTTSVPTKTAPKIRSISPGVPPEMIPRLKELSTFAKRYRAKSSSDSVYSKANEELTTVSKTLRSMGVPTAAIAKAAGVSYRAMAKRVAK